MFAQAIEAGKGVNSCICPRALQEDAQTEGRWCDKFQYR